MSDDDDDVKWIGQIHLNGHFAAPLLYHLHHENRTLIESCPNNKWAQVATWSTLQSNPSSTLRSAAV